MKPVAGIRHRNSYTMVSLVGPVLVGIGHAVSRPKHHDDHHRVEIRQRPVKLAALVAGLAVAAIGIYIMFAGASHRRQQRENHTQE